MQHTRSLSCIDQGTVRKIVVCSVIVEASWGEETWFALSLLRHRGKRTYAKFVQFGTRASTLWTDLEYCGWRRYDDSHRFWLQRLVADNSLILSIMDLDWLHNLVRWVGCGHFFGLEPYISVVYLRIRPEPRPNAKLLEKFPGRSAVWKCHSVGKWECKSAKVKASDNSASMVCTDVLPSSHIFELRGTSCGKARSTDVSESW